MESRVAHRRNGTCPPHIPCVSSHALCSIPTDGHQSTEYKSKGGLKQDELRRRREEQQVEIRRQKREENISKRRNFLPSTGADSDDESGVGSWESPVRLITRRLIMYFVLTMSPSSPRT